MINTKKLSSVGIAGYGAYVPRFRISVDEIARVYEKDGRLISRSLGVKQKAVADTDEDCLTMAVEVSKQALEMAGIRPDKIGACFVGSESFAYAVKPTTVSLAQALGMDNAYFTVDLQFACKAATAGIQIIAGLLEAGLIDYGLVVGSDKAQACPGDVLEYTAGSAAGAIILSRKKSLWLAKLNYIDSFNSDTPDFWRREGQSFPQHAGRFTGEPAYFEHVVKSSKNFLEKISKKAEGFDYAVFHSPNKKFPLKAGGMLGFGKQQMKHSLLVEEIGNPYSASVLISLANVLDKARKNENIFLTSYGSGAGSDNFWFKTTNGLLPGRRKKKKLTEMFKDIEEISYTEYLRKMGEI